MHQFINGDGPFKQQPLTIEMALAEPPECLTEMEEMLIEQRGLHEVKITLSKSKVKHYLASFSWNGQKWSWCLHEK